MATETPSPSCASYRRPRNSVPLARMFPAAIPVTLVMAVIVTVTLPALLDIPGDYTTPAYAQAAVSGHIVINEFDTNPFGNDAGRMIEWVELYNPTASAVDIGKWKIASTTGLEKAMTIPENTIIQPGQFITYTYGPLWFSDTNDAVALYDASGDMVDMTPQVMDMADDLYTWQRVYDGHALHGDVADWKLVPATQGLSNDKILQPPSQQGQNLPLITITTDKEFYIFDQTATISGTVSERRSVERPAFMAEQITLLITGPDYQNTVTLYPDYNLDFSTTLDLKQVLGIRGGTYTVTAEYAGATVHTSFGVAFERVAESVVDDHSISVATDTINYVPGQYITVSGSTSDVVPFATFETRITDPDGTVISSGNSIPVNGAFETSFLLGSVNPVYGTHTVTVTYADRVAVATFDVLPSLRGSSPIELSSDQKAYMLGQTVTISGILNGIWAASLDVTVEQTRQAAILDRTVGSIDKFKMERAVSVSGDGSFEYEFEIPDNTQRLGDYTITFSGDIGSAGIAVSVVEDPDLFIEVTDPLTIQTDRPSYIHNDRIVFTGYVRDFSSAPAEYASAVVIIRIMDESGTPLESMEGGDEIRRGFADNDDGTIDYSLRAVPEGSGRYSVEMSALPNVFGDGEYTAIATYRGLAAETRFSVTDQYNVTQSSISTDKEVYGLGETVLVEGVLPPTGAVHVSITLTKPDGSTIRAGAPIENQRFSWEWNAPEMDRTHSIKEGELRGLKLSVFGVYKIKISTASESNTLYFKLSDDPDNDSLAKTPLFVTTSKTLYKTGEDLVVHGDVILHGRGGEDLTAPTRVIISVKDGSFPFKQIYESRVYPDIGGAFSSKFDLSLGLFDEGIYHVTATYGSVQAASTFSMVNEYVTGSAGPVALQVTTDQDTYHPGEIVIVSGGPNKIISMDDYAISVFKETGEFEADCRTYVCGNHRGSVTTIEPDPTASFVYRYSLPDGVNSVGTYEVTVESSIGIERVGFEVVERSAVTINETATTDPIVIAGNLTIPLANQTSDDDVMTVEPPFVPVVLTEKRDRLSGSNYDIDALAATMLEHGDVLLPASPTSVTGSLIVAAGHERSVNLQVLADDGLCVIGQAQGCMIDKSTGEQGRPFETVRLADGTELRVVYSGSDKRLEWFAIYKGAGQDFLPDMTWNVSVIKDDQVSRFYYKVTYQTISVDNSPSQ